MIRKINHLDQKVLEFSTSISAHTSSPKPLPSTISSLQNGRLTNAFLKTMYILFYPIIGPLLWIRDRIVLTTEELEDFERLLEGAVYGGAVLFLNRGEGEERIYKVLKSCGELYVKLSEKWFPNMEGILFLRINLIKIKMRAHAAVNQNDEVEKCKILLTKLGGSIPSDVENQTEVLLTIANPKNRWLLRFLNGLSQVVIKVVAKLKG